MSDTEPKAETKTEPATKTPAVNIEEVSKRAADAASAEASKIIDETVKKRVGEKLQSISTQLTGEPQPDLDKQALDLLVQQPLKTLAGLKDAAVKEARKEFQQERSLERIQTQIVGKHVQDYPGLNSAKKLAMVEKLAESYTIEGRSYSEALDQACKDTVAEFGLKSVSDIEKEKANTGLPSGGYRTGTNTEFNDQKSSESFLAGMKAKMNSHRGVKQFPGS